MLITFFLSKNIMRRAVSYTFTINTNNSLYVASFEWTPVCSSPPTCALCTKIPHRPANRISRSGKYKTVRVSGSPWEPWLSAQNMGAINHVDVEWKLNLARGKVRPKKIFHGEPHFMLAHITERLILWRPCNSCWDISRPTWWTDQLIDITILLAKPQLMLKCSRMNGS